MKLPDNLTPTGATMLGATIPPADAAAANAKKQAEGTPKTVEQKASPLKVLTKELRTLTPAESKTKEVEFSEYSYQTMVETIADNLDIVNRLIISSPPVTMTDLHKTFYETMKLAYKFKKEDFDDPKKLKEYAEKFLQEHKGQAVRLAKELAEWEAATLQVATDREFVVPKKGEHSTKVRDDFTEVSFIQTQDGSVVSTKPTPRGFWDKVQFWQGKKVVTQIDRHIEGGRNMNVAAGLLNAEQKAYLDKCGWTSRALTPEELLTIDAKLSAKAAFRQEMFVKTGQKDLSKIEVNYIKKSGGTTSYINNRTAYFINEKSTSTRTIIAVLSVEGKNVAKEVKDKVEKEYAERDEKKDEEVVAANTVKKLKDKIAKIKSDANISEAKKTAKIAEIDAEIKRLSEQSQDFNRTKDIRGEIEEADRKKADAEKKLSEWVAKLGGGLTLSNLKKWSDVNDPLYVGRLEKTAGEKKRLLEKAEARKQDLESKIERIIKDNPHFFTDVEVPDGKGGFTVIKKADPTDVNVKRVLDRLEKFDKELVVLEGSGSDSTSELKKNSESADKNFDEAKKWVQDHAEIKALTEQYHKADSDLTRLKGVGITGEIDEVSARVAKLLGIVGASLATKDEVKDVINGVVSPRSTEIKTAMDAKEAEVEKSLVDKEEEKAHPDELSPEKKAQIESMEALIKLYEPPGKEAYEKTFATIESDEAVITNYDPEWDTVFPHDTTKAIKRLIHLYYGDGVSMKYSDQETLFKQVMTLFKTKAIIDIVIDDLEASPLANSGATVATKPATAGPDGLYTNAQILAMFPAGTRISTIDANKIDRDLAIKILDNIRKTIYNVQKI